MCGYIYIYIHTCIYIYNFFFCVASHFLTRGFPDGSDGKESVCNGGDGFSPWVGKILGKGSVYPLQYSCLENPMDRGTWQATVHAVSKSQTRLSD